jgi:hypothetical protein
VYFPHRTFVSDVSEIPISFPFPELPFSILFSIKKYENSNGFVVYRPFSSLLGTMGVSTFLFFLPVIIREMQSRIKSGGNDAWTTRHPRPMI